MCHHGFSAFLAAQLFGRQGRNILPSAFTAAPRPRLAIVEEVADTSPAKPGRRLDVDATRGTLVPISLVRLHSVHGSLLSRLYSVLSEDSVLQETSQVQNNF